MRERAVPVNRTTCNGLLMAMANPLRCVIIGEGALPVACAELLRDKGHEITALFSPDQRVLQWGQSEGIAHASTLSGLSALIEGRPFDYLLSIVHFQKLPDAILRAPRRHAINFHDAPLPRYAGSHATAWALLNGENEHAVTWHVMTARVDAGDILVQVPVDIDPGDTVLTLNAKCHEAAVGGFRMLLDAMEAHAFVPRRQDLSRRTFFARSQRPTAGCILPFDAPAERLDAMLRALDFGPYSNPLGLPKIALGESFAIVTEMGVLDDLSTAEAGTVTAIEPDALVVATATREVELGGFLTLEGVPLSVGEVVERGCLRIGGHMVSPGADRAARLATLCAQWSRHEPFWLAQLAQARPTVLVQASPPSGVSQELAYLDVPVDAGSRSFTATLGLRGGDGVLAAFVALLAGASGAASVDIGFDDARLHLALGDLHTFFAACVPLCVATAGEWEFKRLAQVLGRQLAQVRAHASYARDAAVRDPALRARLESVVPSAWPIVVELRDRVDRAPPERQPPGRALTLRLGTDGDACRLLYDPERLAPAAAERLSHQLARLLQALPTSTRTPLRKLARLAADTGNPDIGAGRVPAF